MSPRNSELSFDSLMNAIPAVLAGVKEIAMVSPPGKDAKIAPVYWRRLNWRGYEIYRCGGVQAIAALAYGTQTIEPVDKIGPEIYLWQRQNRHLTVDTIWSCHERDICHRR